MNVHTYTCMREKKTQEKSRKIEEAYSAYKLQTTYSDLSSQHWEKYFIFLSLSFSLFSVKQFVNKISAYMSFDPYCCQLDLGRVAVLNLGIHITK